MPAVQLQMLVDRRVQEPLVGDLCAAMLLLAKVLRDAPPRLSKVSYPSPAIILTDAALACQWPALHCSRWRAARHGCKRLRVLRPGRHRKVCQVSTLASVSSGPWPNGHEEHCCRWNKAKLLKTFLLGLCLLGRGCRKCFFLRCGFSVFRSIFLLVCFGVFVSFCVCLGSRCGGHVDARQQRQ